MSEPFIIDCPLNVDDRGYVHCVADNMGGKSIQRAYIVENHSKGMVRAWHSHSDGDTYITVISGAAKIAAIDVEKFDKLIADGVGAHKASPPHYVFTLSARKPQVVFIGAGWANGHCSLEDNTKLLVLSTLSFAEAKLDDRRISSNVLHSIWDVKER